MSPNPQFTAALVTFTEKILNEKLRLLCSVIKVVNMSLFLVSPKVFDYTS